MSSERNSGEDHSSSEKSSQANLSENKERFDNAGNKHEKPGKDKQNQINGSMKQKKSSSSKMKKGNSKRKKTSNSEDNQSHLEYLKKMKQEFLSAVDNTMVVPESERVTLEWRHITYTEKVRESKKFFSRGKLVTKRILTDVSGIAKPGNLIGIIGPSGAGKTSLLNILSRRLKGKKVSGDILVNGQHLSNREFSKLAAYVAQDDILMGSMTAEEALLFAAELKLPRELPTVEKRKRVETLLNNLGLTAVKSNFLGYTGKAAKNSGIKRGLSGGERKRVSIALELITNPRLLFLDEPTSGLDSYAARAVMQILRQLAWLGHTVVATVHQPSAEIFRLFDVLVILAEGEIVYNGPAYKAVGYFAKLGYPCPTFKNPADHFMQILFVPPKETKELITLEDDEAKQSQASFKIATSEQVRNLIEAYKKSKLAKKLLENGTSKENATNGTQTSVTAQTKSRSYESSYFTQFRCLYRRTVKNIWREPTLFRARIFQSAVLGLIAGLLWLQVGRDQVGIRNRESALFFMLISMSFGGATGPTYLFAMERAVVMREKASRTYAIGPYFLAKFFADLPINILLPLISQTLLFWMVGFADSFVVYAYHIVFSILTLLVAYSLVLALAALIADTSLLVKIQPLILLPMMVFAGFFLNSNNIPVYFIWLEYISFMRYAFEGDAIALFSGQTFYCKPDQFVLDPVTGVPLCPITTGEQVITSLGFQNGVIWQNIVVLLAMWVGYNLLAFLFLRFLKK
jgi:ABC-type multidrug transport system ATPase subunit/ABC-type multidrug transport system permease subunit